MIDPFVGGWAGKDAMSKVFNLLQVFLLLLMIWSNVVEGINEIVVEKYWIIVNLSFRFVIVPLLNR